MTTDDRRRDALRASGADRQRAASVLTAALREGRLDAAEYEYRAQAVQDAKSVGEVNDLLADLPSQLGVRDWAGHLRIRQADREQAIRWLADALTEGRLTTAEHERRLAGVASATTYADLPKMLDGVPGPPDAAREGLLVSDADRQAVLDELAAAKANGLLSADEHRDLGPAIRRARRYRDLDALAIDLAERADPAERGRAVRRLDHAHAAGQLDAAEHAERVAAAHAATQDRELAALLADLTPATGGRATARSLLALNRRHRLTDAERELAAQELQHALDDGRLTLDEYDDRVQKAYAAGTAAALRPLLRDLVVPDDRPPADRTPRRRPRFWWIPLVAVPAVVIVVAVVVGVAAFIDRGDGGGPAGRDIDVLWTAPFDRPSNVVGQGSWITDRAVIRARLDRLVAYDLADGRVAWTFPVPAEHELCTMSGTVDGNVGVIGYAPASSFECTTLVAVDLGTGRSLWQRPRPGFGGEHRSGDEVAVVGETAIIREPTGFVAVDARANTRKWRLPVAKGCRTYSVTASPDVAALVSACANRAATLALVEVASGTERWRAPLRLSTQDDGDHEWGSTKATVVLSLDPVVVRTSDAGGAFVAFDDQGRRRATIAQAQADMDLAVGAFPYSFMSRPAYRVAVLGDVLAAPARKPGETQDTAIAGFSLTDGRRLWLTETYYSVGSIGVGDGAVVATVAIDFFDYQLSAVSPQDGKVRTLVRFDDLKEEKVSAYVFELRQVGDRYVFVSPAAEGTPPVTVLGPS
ncbi:DUF1707 domain-containing protein [Micromonospora sp. CPCC 206061]|uniref:DUF1707 domain-containing protein n=1 Tax=Micromonospora sp. CPCC 206061 TaxID=3122410 RepID=UPI002FF33E0F